MEDKIEQFEEEKKGGKGLIVLVILLLLICCGLGAFIFMNKDKLLENEKTTVEKESKKDSVKKCDEVKVYETTDESVTKLIRQLVAGMECNALEIFTNDKKVTASDISADRAYDIVMYNQDSGASGTLTLDDLTKIIQKYLGKDYKFDVDKLRKTKGACISHYYDPSTKTFIPQETACGGTCGPHTTYQIVKAYDTNGTLEIDVKVLFVDKNMTGFYSDYNTTNLVSNFDIPVSDYAKGSLYKFIFDEEDGNYVFVSSEPVK